MAPLTLVEQTDRPTTVYVPSLRVRPDDTEARLMLRRVDDELVLVAYSTLECLLAGCGEQSGWVALGAEVLDRLLPALGDPVVLLDVPLAPEDRG